MFHLRALPCLLYAYITRSWIQGHPEYGFGFKALVCHDGVFDSPYNGFSTDELFFVRTIINFEIVPLFPSLNVGNTDLTPFLCLFILLLSTCRFVCPPMSMALTRSMCYQIRTLWRRFCIDAGFNNSLTHSAQQRVGGTHLAPGIIDNWSFIIDIRWQTIMDQSAHTQKTTSIYDTLSLCNYFISTSDPSLASSTTTLVDHHGIRRASHLLRSTFIHTLSFPSFNFPNFPQLRFCHSLLCLCLCSSHPHGTKERKRHWLDI